MNIETKNKLHEISLYINQNPSAFGVNNSKGNSQVNKKSESNIDSKISKKAITKSNIVNSQQRSIQEQMSIIQAQEGRVEKMQKTLEQVKYSYLESLKSQKKELNKEKIQIRYLSKEEEDAIDTRKSKKNNLGLEKFRKDSKTIDVLEGLLNNIKKIKSELSNRKSKLLSLESEVKSQEAKLEQLKMSMNNDYISEHLDSISIQGDINNGILIDIYI